MGLFDTVKNAVGGMIGSLDPDTVASMIEKVVPGGLPSLLQQLQQNGYGQQVSSWLGHGPNDPIDAQDLQNVLGSDQVKEIADRFGIPADKVLEVVSKLLPATVDQQSPTGQLQPSATPDDRPQ